MVAKEAAGELQSIFESGNETRLIDFFKDKTEAERAEFASTAMATFRKLVKAAKWDAPSDVQYRPSLHATLLTATSDQLKELSFIPLWSDHLNYGMLEQFNPSGMRKLGDILIEQHFKHLHTIFMLIERDLCDFPQSDQFVIACMGSGNNWARFARRQSGEYWLLDALESTPQLQSVIWRMFELEGNTENNLAGHDKYCPPANSWATNLQIASERGLLSRERLLDESLNALERGFLQFRAGWFSRFHEQMKPTSEERAGRAEMYGRLIASPIPPTVSFALEALLEIDKASALSKDFLSEYLPPAMTSKQKAAVVAALNLLGKSVSRDKSFSEGASLIAAKGLTHEAPDVQSKVLSFLQKHNALSYPSVQAEVAQYADLLSPSVRTQLAKTAPASVVVGEEQVELETYTHIPYPDDWNPLAVSPRIEQISKLDELIDAMSLVLEHPSESMQIERVLDGVSRLAGSDQETFRTKLTPLIKRAQKVLKRRSEHAENITALHVLLAEFYIALNDGAAQVATAEEIGADSAGEDEQPIWIASYNREKVAKALIIRRLNSILSTVQKGLSLPCLGTPDSENGWLTPDELVGRLAQWERSGHEPPVIEQMLALMRLPLCAPKLLGAIVSHRSALGKAAKYATAGGELPQPLTPLWRAAEAFHNPPEFGSHLDLGFGRLFQQSNAELIRWQQIMFPSLREAFFGASIRITAQILDYLDVPSRNSGSAYFSALLDQSQKLGPNGWQTVAISLYAGDAQLTGYAKDALGCLIEAGHLDIGALASELRRFLYSEKGNPQRIAKSLGDVARLGGKSTDAVRQLLEATLTGGNEVPRNYAAILELLHEVLVQERACLTNPATIEHLKTLSGEGKAKKLANSILKLQ